MNYEYTTMSVILDRNPPFEFMDLVLEFTPERIEGVELNYAPTFDVAINYQVAEGKNLLGTINIVGYE